MSPGDATKILKQNYTKKYLNFRTNMRKVSETDIVSHPFASNRIFLKRNRRTLISMCSRNLLAVVGIGSNPHPRWLLPGTRWEGKPTDTEDKNRYNKKKRGRLNGIFVPWPCLTIRCYKNFNLPAAADRICSSRICHIWNEVKTEWVVSIHRDACRNPEHKLK